MVEARTARVVGRVQRVGFRRYVQDVGQEEGVSGHVRNEDDGSVTVFAQGERGRLDAFFARIRQAEPPVAIRSIEVRGARPKPRMKKGFRTVSANLGDDFNEGMGAMQSEFRDYRSEFKGFHGEFRDYRSEFRDYRAEFRGFAERTDSNFRTMNDKYGEISAKLSAIMDGLADLAKRSQEMLESMRREEKETAASLNESLRLLRDAVERLPKAS